MSKKCSGMNWPLQNNIKSGDCTSVDFCKAFTPKIITNWDMIKSLSEEAFVKFLFEFREEFVNNKNCIACAENSLPNCFGKDCVYGYKKWLQTECEVDE